MSYTVECGVCGKPFTKFSNIATQDWKCPDCRRDKKLDLRIGKLNDVTIKLSEKIKSLESMQEMILDTVLAEIKLLMFENLDEEVSKVASEKFDQFKESLAKVNTRLMDLNKRMDDHLGVDI